MNALNAGRLSLYDLEEEEEELPENMKAMSFKELETYVEEMRNKRAELRQQSAECVDITLILNKITTKKIILPERYQRTQ